ncbi:RTase [Symbiodinium sp. CCMP2592]|nr:RTase [Symbiodinium sp. CCMP2592]
MAEEEQFQEALAEEQRSQLLRALQGSVFTRTGPPEGRQAGTGQEVRFIEQGPERPSTEARGEAAANFKAPESLEECSSVDEIAKYLASYWSKHKALPVVGEGSHLESVLQKALTTLRSAADRIPALSDFAYEGNLTPVDFREFLVGFVDFEFQEKQGLKITKSHPGKEIKSETELAIRAAKAKVAELEKIMERKVKDETACLSEIKNLEEASLEGKDEEEKKKHEETLQGEKDALDGIRSEMETVKKEVEESHDPTFIIQKMEVHLSQKKLEVNAEDFDSYLYGVLILLAGNSLFVVAFCLAFCLAVRGPKRASQIAKGTSGKAAGRGKKTVRMKAKGQAFIRSVMEMEEKIMKICAEVTGRSLSSNTFIGVVPEVMMSLGEDSQLHGVSTLSVRVVPLSWASGMASGQIRLGQGMNVPVPTSEDEASPKRRREGDVPTGPPGLSGDAQVSLDMRAMEVLLQQQCAAIVAANRTHLETALTSLEERVAERIKNTEIRQDNVEERVGAVEGRLEKIEQLLRQPGGRPTASAGDMDDRRKFTLVFGGWRQDTPRRTIVAEVSEALRRLDVAQHTDSEPFTTGPRRSVALLGFSYRRGEGFSDVRQRMHKVLMGLSQAKPLTSHNKPMWCSYSKTRAERDVSSHAGWVKRSLAALSAEIAQALDVEYGTGTVWLGESMLASATRSPPDGVSEECFIREEHLVCRPWIDVQATARECKMRVFGWNIGGAPVEDLPRAVKENVGAGVELRVGLVQELPRRQAGWSSTTLEGLRLLQHRHPNQWRGVGILFQPSIWGVISRKTSRRGIWVLLRHLESGQEIWFGTLHLQPGLPQAEYHADAADYFSCLPSHAKQVVFQGDVNAPLAWASSEVGDVACGLDGKAILLLDVLFQKGLLTVPPSSEQQHLPTSRPRQVGREGSRIDLFASRGLLQQGLTIFEDSCFSLGTDHELQEGCFSIKGQRIYRRPQTRARVWTGGIDSVEGLNQATLQQLAKTCTKPKPGNSFRDSHDTKLAFRRARVSKSKEAWKAALMSRRADRKKWEADRLFRASQCDWSRFKELRAEGQGTAWDEGFADSQAGDPHMVVESFLSNLYKGEKVQLVTEPQGEVRGFTVEEVRVAVSQLKRGKSVGNDLTGRELFEGILSLDGGASHLAEFFTGVLCTKAVPEEWNKSILILLAKLANPTLAKDLRPIALGSGTSKLFSRLLINRCLPLLGAKSPYQTARACDYIFSAWRICELCREWGLPLTMVKIDVQKAFDSVNRSRLLAKLRSRLGPTHEMACWERLLSETTAILSTPWGVSEFEMCSGIKQGAVESPTFFSLLMEEALEETISAHGWDASPSLFDDFAHESMLFMDDGLLWARDPCTVAQRLEQLRLTLLSYGLTLNIKKCQMYCSKDVVGPRVVTIQGVELQASDSVEVMGLKLKKGVSICELLQPLVARAKQKFWSQKHLLRCRSPLRGRLQLLHRVVAGAGLWCIAAFPPCRSAMGLLNSVQAMLVGWAMRLSKSEGESWVSFRQRVVRSSRVALVRYEIPRWSTLWLRRWWDFSGHRVRGLLSQAPPLSSYLDEFRSLAWWRRVQANKQGPRHPHHFARLTALEESMNSACQGPWRAFAHDRANWAQLRDRYVRACDLPWASGRQLALPACLYLSSFGDLRIKHHARLCAPFRGPRATMDDRFYEEWTLDPQYDMEHQMGASYIPQGSLPILPNDIMQWARYTEEHFHDEYLDVYFPHQQLALLTQAGEAPTMLLPLAAPAAGEQEWERARRLHYNFLRNVPAEIAVLHGLMRASGDEPGAHLQLGPPPNRLAEWMFETVVFLRAARGEAHDGWGLQLLRTRSRSRPSVRYGSRAAGYIHEVETLLPHSQAMGVEPPDYVLDWAIIAEGELYSLLARDEDTPSCDATSLVQGSQPIKRQWLKKGNASDRRRHKYARQRAEEERQRRMGSQGSGASGACKVTTSTRVLRPDARRPPPSREAPSSHTGGRAGSSTDVKPPATPPQPLTLDEAADVWSIILGLATEDEVDAKPGTILGEVTTTSILETILDYNLQDRLTMTLAFQGVVARMLKMVGMIIEDAMETDRARHRKGPEDPPDEGDATGFMQTGGALVTTDREWETFLLDLRHAFESMTKGSRKANAEILHIWLDHRATDEAQGKCLGHMSGRPAQLLSLLVVVFESCEDMEGGQPGGARLLLLLALELHLSEVCLPCIHVLLLLVPRVRALDPEIYGSQGALEDEYMEQHDMLRHLSPEEYRQWELRQMELAMSSPPPKRTRMFLRVELSSGSSDAPRVSRELLVPLEPQGTGVSLRIGVVHAPRDTATQPVPVVDQVSATILDTAGEAGQGNGSAKPVAADLDRVTDHNVAGSSEGLPGAMPAGRDEVPPSEATTVPCEVGQPALHFVQSTLTYADFEALYADWVAGRISLDTVEARYGSNTRELMEVQRVAELTGLETQEGNKVV